MYKKNDAKMFQVSTLQALALGYSRAVIDVAGLMQHVTLKDALSETQRDFFFDDIEGTQDCEY